MEVDIRKFFDTTIDHWDICVSCSSVGCGEWGAASTYRQMAQRRGCWKTDASRIPRPAARRRVVSPMSSNVFLLCVDEWFERGLSRPLAEGQRFPTSRMTSSWGLPVKKTPGA